MVLAVLFVCFGAGYAVVVPPGESPDEAAHVEYVDHVVRDRALPPLGSFSHLSYEAHQPPLDYLVSAILTQAVHGGPINYPFVPNSALSFFARGSRAFVPAEADVQRDALVALRLLRLFWGIVTLTSLVLIARRFTPDSSSALAAAMPFALAPQFLFISSSINNDVSVTALSTMALALLVRTVSEDGSVLAASAAGLFAGLALSSKVSGAFLAPVVAAAVVLIWRDRRKMLALAASYAAAVAIFVGVQLWRFGVLLPPLPRSESAAAASGWSRLFDLWWLGSAWLSFWGKFGWLNLPMNRILYIVFVPATLALLSGVMLWRRRAANEERRALLIIDMATLSIASLFVLYLALVDWQPQGRYLFVALGSAVAYTGRCLAVLQGRFWVVATSIILSIAGATAGLITIVRAY